MNQWELITFDFSSYIRQGTYLAKMIDQVVVFPDFDVNGRAQVNICYFGHVLCSDSVAVDFKLYISKTKKLNFKF
tara:strand:+ start:132 stop:356 length:225 start_codon:yes stop_codon:yes gene_type:complete